MVKAPFKVAAAGVDIAVTSVETAAEITAATAKLTKTAVNTVSTVASVEQKKSKIGTKAIKAGAELLINDQKSKLETSVTLEEKAQ